MAEISKQQWIEENNSLIWNVVYRYSRLFDHKLYDRDDLYQICIIAVLEKAFESYDESKGVKFSTWASTIMSQAMQNEIRKNNQKRRSANVVSVDTFEENISEECAGHIETVENLICNNEDYTALQQSMSVLSPEEHFVFSRLYGIGCVKLTQKEIADIFDFSQGLISKIFEKAKIKIIRELKFQNVL